MDEDKKQEENNDEEKVEQTPPILEEKSADELAAEYLHNWKRALADYDNLKKDVAKEKSEMGQFARSLAAIEFTAVYDNYKKALAHKPNLEEIKETATYKVIEQWVMGIEYIRKQFVSALNEMGVDEIKTVGEQFNPVLHEAVGEEEGGKTGVILKEVEGGYKMGEKVIKAAKVIISK